MTAFFDEVKGVTVVEAISNDGAEQRKFENGCILSVSSDGWVTGTNPYGWDDLFLGAAEQDSVGRVQRWLAFWSEPRDERGQLIADHETRLKKQSGSITA